MTTSLTLVRHIRARPETVFAALTRPDQIAKWWGPDAGPVLRTEVDARIGGAFRIRFRMLDGSEHESFGTYLVFDPPRRLSMTWQWTGDEAGPEAGESRVDVALRPIESGTELTFTHAQLPDEETRASHEEGWSGALDKLVALFRQEGEDR